MADPFFVGLNAFVTMLQREFPKEASELEQAKTYINVSKTFAPETVKQEFRDFISPYKSSICDKNDITPLLQHDPGSSGYAKLIVGHIMRVKELWYSEDVTSKQRATVTLYLQRLIKVSENWTKHSLTRSNAI